MRTIFKVKKSKKEYLERLSVVEFPPTFSQCKEGNQQTNEIKSLELMDAKFNIKEVDISNDDRPKMEKIGDYWNEE